MSLPPDGIALHALVTRLMMSCSILPGADFDIAETLFDTELNFDGFSRDTSQHGIHAGENEGEVHNLGLECMALAE